MGPTDLPEPEARRRVLEAVLDYPGTRLIDVARDAGLNPSLVEYHTEALLDAELVVEANYAGHRRFYPLPGPTAPALEDAEWLALLRERVPFHLVLLLLLADGPLTHTELHRAVGIAKSTLSFHLGKLLEVRILDPAEGGGYALSDRARAHHLVVRYRPTPDLLGAHFAAWVRLYRALSGPL